MGRRNQVAKSTQRYLARTTTAEWKTALYARLSDENNGLEDDRSLQNQIKYLEEYIEKHPYLGLVDRYVDNGRSGMSFKRAEFQRMMEDVKDGRINCVVVKDFSRFGRNHIEAGYYLETIFPQLDVRFISVNDNFDSMGGGKSSDIMVPLKNMINEMYAKDTQRKVLATLRAKEQKGERAFNMAPYGYVIDPECNYHLLTDPETADYVRLAFSLSAGGLGSTGIADRLDKLQAPTPLAQMKRQGKRLNVPDSRGWDYTSVMQMLRNRTYTGATVYNTKGKGEYKVIPNTHEALVSEEVFEAVNKDLDERGRKRVEAIKEGKKRSEQFPNILQGVFYCGECGHAMLYDRTKNTKVLRNFRYRCSGYSSYRKDSKDAPPCGTKIACVPEQVVYKFVLDQIRHQLNAGLELEKLEQLLQTDAKERKRKADGLKAQEASLKQKLRKLYEDYADKIITEEEYMEFRKAYSEQIKSLQAQIEDAESGKMTTDPWTELKEKLFGDETGGETVGTTKLTETSSLEIIEDDKPDMVERLLRRGLTRELVETMIERLEYSVDGSFSIRFKCEDYAEKLLTRQLETDMKGE
ncbi:MAG: recombinase family protein [Ruminococcus sp.]|nr:recombinase family protein [Ruminococcus sp.]